jgi:hypothetical protein
MNGRLNKNNIFTVIKHKSRCCKNNNIKKTDINTMIKYNLISYINAKKIIINYKYNKPTIPLAYKNIK